MYAQWLAKTTDTMAADGNRRVLMLCTDGGLHSDFAFNYYCTDVHKLGDFMLMLYCPDIDLQPGENKLNDEDGARRLKQLVLDEGNRIIKDTKVLERKLKENLIDGKVVVASAVISPKESIIDLSEKENVDIIILGARRLGQGLRQDGSTKQHVVRKSKVPVLICKHKRTTGKSREGVKRLVLAGSDCGLQASEGLIAYRKHIYREGDFMLLVNVPKSRALATRKNSGHYCTDVHKLGDFMLMLYCPDIDLQPGENKLNDEDGARRLKQLVLDEGNRIIKDTKVLERKLKENLIDGKVVVASAVISPKESIIDLSEKENVDIIILGARRLGQGLRQDGSTKQHVVRKSKVPVLICKHKRTTGKSREGVKRLVLAGSDCGLQASEGLIAYRKHIYREGDFMLLVNVPKSRALATRKNSGPKAITTASTGPRLQQELQELYAANASLLQDFIEKTLKMPGEVIVGEPDSNPGDTLLEVAKRENADLIVIGARGLSQQAYEASSRTSDKVANDSEVTVFMNKY